MTINWGILVIVIIAALALIIYLIKRNLRDEKEVTEYFDNEYNSNLERKSDLDEDDTH